METRTMDDYANAYDRYHAGPDLDGEHPALTSFERHAFAGLLERLLETMEIEGGPATFEIMRAMAVSLRVDDDGEHVELAQEVVAAAFERAEEHAFARMSPAEVIERCADDWTTPVVGVEITEMVDPQDADPERPWVVSLHVRASRRGRGDGCVTVRAEGRTRGEAIAAMIEGSPGFARERLLSPE